MAISRHMPNFAMGGMPRDPSNSSPLNWAEVGVAPSTLLTYSGFNESPMIRRVAFAVEMVATLFPDVRGQISPIPGVDPLPTPAAGR